MKRRIVMRWLAVAMAGAMAASGAAINTLADFPRDIWAYAKAEDEDDNTIYDFKEVEVAVPKEWKGKYQVERAELSDGSGSAAVFYHPASRKAYKKEFGSDAGGVLFSVCYSENYDFLEELADYQIIGSGAEGVYYLTFPTDVQGYGYTQQDNTWQEWESLADDSDWIRENVQMIAPGEGIVDVDKVERQSRASSTGTDGYIVADSSDRELTVDDLKGLSADQLQMAINEIYARHGRKFATKSIQKYFNEKSWYTGKIEPSKFDETSLSLTEGKNIALMIQCMKDNSAGTSGSQSSTESGAAGQSQVVSCMSMVATATVNIRSKASVNGSVMGVVPQGYGVTATGSVSNGWIPVEYGGIRGYISAQYLKEGTGITGQTSQPGAGQNSPSQSEVPQSGGEQSSTSQSEAPQSGDAQTEGLQGDMSGGDVSATPLNLYVGAYHDADYFAGLLLEEAPTYYEMMISYVGDTGFDFIINKMDAATGNVLETLANGKAEFAGTGMTATSPETGCFFEFPDYHNAYPDVTDIVVSGISELEGVPLINNGIPGHEFN